MDNTPTCKSKTVEPLEVGKKDSMTVAQANKYSLGYKVPNIKKKNS